LSDVAGSAANLLDRDFCFGFVEEFQGDVVGLGLSHEHFRRDVESTTGKIYNTMGSKTWEVVKKKNANIGIQEVQHDVKDLFKTGHAR
jgi:hypothetical protein